MWDKIESDVFSTEWVKTRSQSTGTLLLTVGPSELRVPPSVSPALEVLLPEGGAVCLTCLQGHPLVWELGHHPEGDLARKC